MIEMDKEKQVQQVGAMIDKWLDDIDSENDVKRLDSDQIREIDAIIDSFVEIAIVGLNKQPNQWNDEVVGEVMFSRFLLLLEENEKTASLYELIPFALKKLFGYLGKQGLLQNASHLIDWVNINSKGLTSLYDPKFDAFYRDLAAAMRREGINTHDKKAVDEFTKLYLKQHPDLGINLYSDNSKK